MQKFSFLVLTDHESHSATNSIYRYLSALVKHPQCRKVDVASRSLDENQNFFYENKFKRVFTTKVGNQFSFSQNGESFIKNISACRSLDYDIILLRLPHPTSNKFLSKLKEYFQDKLIINDPLGIVKTSAKSYLLEHKQLCPPIFKLNDSNEVQDKAKEMDFVLKPLNSYGGAGIIKISGGTAYHAEGKIEELHDLLNRDDFIAGNYLGMKYLKNVKNGDKRIVVANGKPIVARLRMPSSGSWICNVRAGGSDALTEITKEESNIINDLDPHMNNNNIFLYGIDTLEDDQGKRVLSEINTLSVGGFGTSDAIDQIRNSELVVSELFNYINQQ